jgi:cobalt-zinc-cadmium efflux system membrane fusion protein
MKSKFIRTALPLVIFAGLSLALVTLTSASRPGADVVAPQEHEQDDHDHEEHESDAPHDVEELLEAECEHNVKTVDCDECRYEIGAARMSPALAEGLLEGRPVRSTLRAAKQLRVTGQVQLDLRRVVEIASVGAGRVEVLNRILGDTVKASDVLAEIQSSDFGRAQADFLQAHAALDLSRQTYEREKRLNEQKVSSRADFLAADKDLIATQAAAAAAKKRLSLFGLSDAQIEALRGAEPNGAFGRLVLTSPIDGSVTEQNIVRGRQVNAGDTLYQIADLSRVWIWADVYESDIAALHERVTSGQTVQAEVRTGAFAETSFKATVEMMDAQLNPKTRTLKVRLVAENPQRKLKPGMFVTVSIDLGDDQTVLQVPQTAVLSDEGRHFVFLQLADDLWIRRDVGIGRIENGHIEVIHGLAEGDVVATKGAFMFKSEVLKEKMGAGCAH